MPAQVDDIHDTGSATFHDGNYGNANLVCAEIIVLRATFQQALTGTYFVFMKVTNQARSTESLSAGELDVGLYSNANDTTRNRGFTLNLGSGQAAQSNHVSYQRYINSFINNDPAPDDPAINRWINNVDHASFNFRVLQDGDQISVGSRGTQWYFLENSGTTSKAIEGVNPTVDDHFQLYFTPVAA